MKITTITLIILIVLSGCRLQRTIIKEIPVETKTTIIERLVTVETPADSALLYAYIECDSSYNILLKSIDEHKTAGMKTNIQLTNSKLSYQVVRIKDKIYIPAKDSIIIKEVPVKIEVPVKVNELTTWQYIQIWAGRIFLMVLCLTGLYNLAKWKFR